MKCTALGIDLAKSVFHLYGVDKKGQVVVQKQVSRGKLRKQSYVPDTGTSIYCSRIDQNLPDG